MTDEEKKIISDHLRSFAPTPTPLDSVREYLQSFIDRAERDSPIRQAWLDSVQVKPPEQGAEQ